MSGGMRRHVRLQGPLLATQSMACHSASPALNPHLQNPHLSTPLSHPFSITRYNMPILQHVPWALISIPLRSFPL
ncbi:hypothetical protein BD310DRAFT_921265, partial [Dichomitus squalens]